MRVFIIAVVMCIPIIGNFALAQTMHGGQGMADGRTMGSMMPNHEEMMEQHHGAMSNMGVYQQKLMSMAEQLRGGNVSPQDQVQMGEDLSQMAEMMENAHMGVGMDEDASE